MLITAQDESQRAFLNSFLRDFSGNSNVFIYENWLNIIFREFRFSIRLKKFSLVGSHIYHSTIFKVQNEKVEFISFQKFVEEIEQRFFKLDNNSFSEKVINSQKNMQEELISALNEKSNSTYLESEQNLYFGHPFHPYPKFQSPFESARTIKIIWLELPESQYRGVVPLQEYKIRLLPLVEFELGLNTNVSEGHFFFPTHPALVKKMSVTRVLEGKHTWNALSSKRSFFHPKAPFQLKFSLPFKLTNSVRLISFEETTRGLQLEAFLMNRNKSQLKIMREPFAVFLKDDPKMAVQFREQTYDLKDYVLGGYLAQRDSSSTNSIVYDLILQFHNNDSQPIIASQLKWFDSYLQHAVRPLLVTVIEEGILLGAHMQNVLIKIESGFPTDVIYRDLQGCGFSKEIIDKEKIDLPFQEIFNKNLLGKKDINKVVGYYLIVNNVFNILGAVSNWNSYVERILISRLKNALIKLQFEFPESSFLNYLLHSDGLWQKGNFRCSVSSFDENTMKDPWKIYNQIDNPLVAFTRKNLPMAENYEATFRNRKISFRKADPEKDSEIFHKWHNQKFVFEFWEMNQSLKELKAYLKEKIKDPAVEPYIFEVDNQPVGYFEFYWAIEDRIAPYCKVDLYDRGIHLLIGEKSYLNSKIVYLAMLHATKFLFEQDSRTKRVYGEPRADNTPIRRFAERLPGWKFLYEFDFPHKRAALLECERSRFYKEFIEESDERTLSSYQS